MIRGYNQEKKPKARGRVVDKCLTMSNDDDERAREYEKTNRHH